MKKVFGITLGGLQKKTILLVVSVLLIAVAALAAASSFQTRMLTEVVGETRIEQQQAISQVSRNTMHETLEAAIVSNTTLRANLADNDFSEIVNDTFMLQTMAHGLLMNRKTITPLMPSPPNPAQDGQLSAMVLCEEGVDYRNSQYLGILGHMSTSMIAMVRNSDKIDGCYIGLCDGTHLGVDIRTKDKFDENGRLIPFPVRERPWYKGAMEAEGLYFTGIEKDAFSDNIFITCALPILEDGSPVGVIGLDIVLESMEDFVNADTSQGSYAFVVNDRGQVVLGPKGESVFSAEMAEKQDLRTLGDGELSQFVDKALRESTELTVITVDGKPYYMVGAPMPTIGWAVISVVDKEITEQPERMMLSEYDRINEEASAKFRAGTEKTKETVFTSLVALLVVGVIAAMIAANRIVKPIEQMTKSIVRSGMTGEPFRMEDCYRTNDEIEVLAEAFADLSQKTRDYIGQITKITAEKERINTELSLATRIQTAMMPHIFPAFPGRSEIDIYACMNPAKEVGGDFYDYFFVDDDHLCLVIADISGKGIPAALFMMASKIILQSCAMLGKSAGEILTMTNTAICSNNQEEMFVTAWIGILEISTGKLTAANAGHEYPVMKKPGGDFTLIKDKHGLVIGAMDGMRYQQYELQLEPGTKIFVYTDGVPEATDADEKLFGTRRMLDALNQEPDASPERLLNNVQAAVDDYVKDAEQFDDLTMLCVEYKGVNQVFEMTVEAEVEKLFEVQGFVEEKLEAAGCPMKTQMEINVAVEEIFVNIASYAYEPGKGDARIRVELSRSPAAVTITFMDRGIPFDPLAKADPNVTLSAGEREIGGLGIFMTKKLMDEVHYAYRDGQNILTMKKQFPL